MINRLTQILTISGFAMILLMGSACQLGDSSKKISTQKTPNIVLIMVDDQGWGDLSLTGNPIVNTPNIDQMAKEGAIMDRFYVSPVCSPTRAELLTGRHAVRGGVYSTSAGGERLDLDETTFADVLREAGYKTGAFGKWHNGMQYPYHPNARGFDEFYGYCSGHWGSYFDAMLEHNGELVSSKGFLTDVLTDKAIEFIEENQHIPFLVYLPLNTPHSPMQVPDRWWNKFKDAELPQHRYSDKDKPDHTRAAYAMAENIDWNVGKVAKKLKELGLNKNTIVIYLSDNGPNGWRWNGGMEGTKGSTDEGGVRTPFVVQWEGEIIPGKVIPEIASARDIFPTLLDIAGIEHNGKKSLDGKSLKPLWLEAQPKWEDRLIVSHWRNHTSVRSQEFRLDHKNQLFQMVNDPGQETNSADKYPEVYSHLMAAKVAWEKEVLPELPQEDLRTFPIGHPDDPQTQLPARDGIAHVTIERSNRWPNCSFYTHWTSESDSITWEVEVLESGDFEAVIYYTCSPENVGTIVQLSMGDEAISQKVTEAFDPPLRGMEHDKFDRGESYVKDWKPLSLGSIHLQKGMGVLSLKALEIPGEMAIDFRLMMLRRK